MAKSLLTQFIALQGRTGNAPAAFLMPSSASRDEQTLANQNYAEMSRVAEDRLTYLNEMLQSSEFYLDHDRKQEQADNEK